MTGLGLKDRVGDGPATEEELSRALVVRPGVPFVYRELPVRIGVFGEVL